MTTHDTRQERDGALRRWTCDGCPWATAWTVYTDPHGAAAAIRHAVGRRQPTQKGGPA